MRSSTLLLLLRISLKISPFFAIKWPESRMLRGGDNEMLEGDPSPSSASSRTLFEEFSAFFYESLDINEEDEDAIDSIAAPSERSDFLSNQMDILSKTATFSGTLSSSPGDSKGTFYYIDWSVTGPDLQCSPVVNPHIKLTCSNGGRIHIDHPCIVVGLDTAVCIHGYHFMNHLSDNVGVWCSGNDEIELGLNVELVGGDASCKSADGEISQGISVGQACGAFQSEEFRVNVKESFCNDPTQYVPAETEDENPKCASKVAASEENLLVSLPPVEVSVTPSSSNDSKCIYEINA